MKLNVYLSAGFMLLATIAGSPCAVLAQSNDSIAQALAKTRQDYETSMKRLEKDISAAIKVELSQAKDIGKLNIVRTENDAFEQAGALPDFPKSADFTQRYAVISDKMKQAYVAAALAYAKSDNKQLANAVSSDAMHFGESIDLVPWKDGSGPAIKPGGKPASGWTVLSRQPLSVNCSAGDEYRVEAVGRRTGAAGAVNVTFPTPDGQSITLPVDLDAKGYFHVILSVFKNHVSADLGLPRPVLLPATIKNDSLPPPPPEGMASRSPLQPQPSPDLASAVLVPTPTAKIIVIQSDSTMLVEAVRTKSIIAGAPPAKAAIAAGNAPAAGAGNALVQGSKWTGTMNRKVGQPVTVNAVIQSIRGNQLVLRAVTVSGTSDLTFTMNGNDLILTNNQSISDKSISVSNVHGSGRVNGDAISIDASWDIAGRGWAHGQKATINLEKN